MDIMEEPQLFGAGRGEVNGVTVCHNRHSGGRWTITTYVHTVMRMQPMTFAIRGGKDQNPDPVLTSIFVIAHRCPHLSGNLARRNLWALHKRWGSAGYEVQLDGAGAPPTK